MVSSSSGESVVKNDRLLSEGMSGHFFLPLSWCFSLCSSFHVISKVTCTMVTISVSSIRISEIDIQHPSFRRKHPERSLQKAALLTPASLWGEHAEPVRTQSRLAFWVNALAAEAASTAYHKIIRFATKTPPASHLCAAPGACFFCGESSPNVNLHKTLP